MTTRNSRIGAACLLAGLIAVAPGCSSSTSRNYVTVQEATAITKGKELADLQRALDEAAINRQEFEQLRKVILKRPN